MHPTIQRLSSRYPLTKADISFLRSLINKRKRSGFVREFLRGDYDNYIDAYYTGEEHFLKGIGKFFKKVGKGVGSSFKAVGKALKKISIKKIFKGIKRIAYAPLLPFKGAMKKGLNKKGIKYDNHIDDIADKFFKNIVKGKHYDGREHLAVVAIIAAIIGFIKNLKKSKDEGADVGEVGNAVIEGANQAADEVVDATGQISDAGKAKIVEQGERDGGEFVMPTGNNKMLMYIVIAIVAFVLLRK